MQLTLLGTGLPTPNPDRCGPAHLVRAGGHHFLLDCGSGVVHQLVRIGVSPAEIDHLLITHLHSDHFIDLGHFIVTRWIMGDDRPLHVYGPAGTRWHADRVAEWLEPDIRMRMKIRKRPRELPNLIVHELDEGPALDIDGVTATAFEVDHFPLDQPFGYRFDTKDRSIVFSGDTAPSENLIRHAHGADLLLHECVEEGHMDKGQAYTSQKASHTPPDRLALVAKEAAVKTLVTTHMMPGSVPAELHEIIRRDFKGPTVIGEDLMTG